LIGEIDITFGIDRRAFGELVALRNKFQFRAGSAGNLGVGGRSAKNSGE